MVDVQLHPCRYLARAWWGEQLLAESTAAVRVEVADQAPVLCFPCEDVAFEQFVDAGPGIVGTPPTAARLWNLAADPVGGEGVLWSFEGSAPDGGRPAGSAAFDHDRVRVELIDAVEGDSARDVTTKRFPTWGDAADLVDILDVRPDEHGGHVSVARADHRRPVVEASQMLGQAIVAAGRHAPGRRVVSASMVAMRVADARVPLHVDLEELSAGRSFTTLAAHVGPEGRRCASGILLLGVTSPDVIRHAVAPPDTAGPYLSEPFDMGVMGRDVRFVDDAYPGDASAPVGPPILDAWVRFREVPDDPYLHAGLLAQFTGHVSIAAALRPHAGIGQEQAHVTLSTAINAINISFHREVRADRWMLYRHLSTFAGDGMTHSECRVHDEDGHLLASFTVDAMVRPFAPGTVGNERTSL